MKDLGELRWPHPSQEEGSMEETNLPAQRLPSKGSFLHFVTTQHFKTGQVWLFFSKVGLWRTKLKIFIFFPNLGPIPK